LAGLRQALRTRVWFHTGIEAAVMVGLLHLSRLRGSIGRYRQPFLAMAQAGDVEDLRRCYKLNPTIAP
jgi:hypothetical protein